MAAFEDFIKAVKDGAIKLSEDVLQGYLADAGADTKHFLDLTRTDLQKWTKALAEGLLSKKEFNALVHGLASLAVLHALTEEGIALTRIQRFRDGLIELVIDSAFKFFLP